MKRRALIIYCSNTASGRLTGPTYDNYYYRNFLESNLGGSWNDREILSLENPTSYAVSKAMRNFFSDADYTFTVFSGHGFINASTGLQYVELLDAHVPIFRLKTSAVKQTLIVDACRGYYQNTNLGFPLRETVDNYGIGDISSTRDIFDSAIRNADPGWSVLFASRSGQSALDTTYGGAYLLSLLHIAKNWERQANIHNIFPVNAVNRYATNFMHKNFNTRQSPQVYNDRFRQKDFPLFVKQATHASRYQYSRGLFA